MAFTRDWDETTPTDNTYATQIDDYNRYLRADMSDRLKNMVYGLIAGENTLAQHFQYVQFYEQTSVSQPSAGFGRVYCKAVSGKAELFWQDEDGNEIQLTTGGKLNGAILKDATVPVASIANYAYVPVGTVTSFAGSSAPTGWLLCNGSEVSQTTYAALYAVLGADAFGTDAGGNFFLPDMRGRVPLGVGTGDAADATAHTLATKEGTEGTTLTAAQSGVPEHSHPADVQYKNPEASPVKFSGCATATGTGTANTNNNTAQAASAAHSNLQPSLGLNFIIKY